MFPCIKESNLGLFTCTADQRFLLGEETFLRTHYPIVMTRFSPDNIPDEWSEEELYREIMSNSQSVMGNRNFVLYGAAGSGKSETMRWLMNRIAKTSKGPYMLRISRTELDPVKILQKILLKFKGIELEDSVHHQWEDLRKKPITLANHLVWASLGKLLSSDMEIIPLSYQLRPLLEKNLTLNFSGIDNPEDFSGRTAELVSIEDLETITRQCSIPIDIDCEQLRYQMTKEFENAILGGYNFVKTLKQISEDIFSQTGIRPVLLIDDLVQSLNIYSTELIDFFITMEEGNWDIIFGLTPSSFESTKKGKDVLERISNLDTFDDRLIKLWLSDEHGNNSYFINIDNCHHFASRYLAEVKKMGGFVCSHCSMNKGCTDLQMETSLTCTLAPFNEPFLRRIFKSLPSGKGKARYFIMTLGQILRDINSGNLVNALQNHIERELSLNHPHQIIRLVGEAFLPEKTKNEDYVKIKSSIISMFVNDIENVEEEIVIRISDLSASRPSTDSMVQGEDEVFSELNTGKAAIRDWLEDIDVNKELLKGLRLGIAHICREVAQPNNIIRPNTSRLSPLMKWDQSVEGSKIPIKFEGIDDFVGINVSRKLGHTAFLLNYVHLKRGQGKELLLENAFNSSDELHFIMVESRKMKEEIRSNIFEQVCMPIDEFAYNLFIILMEIGQGGVEIPNIIYTKYYSLQIRYPKIMTQQIPSMPTELAETVRGLFKDWFLLRESIYDSVRLIELGKKYKNSDPIIEIFKVNPDLISPQLKIGGIEFKKFVSDIQNFLNQLLKVIKGHESEKTIKRVDQLILMISHLGHPTGHMDFSSKVVEIFKYMDKTIIDVPEWQNCSRLKSRIRRSLRSYLNKESLKLESPIDIHRLLVQVHSLEHDPDYLTINDLMNFFEEAIIFIEESESKLNTDIELNGLSGYITDNVLWSKGRTCLDASDELEYDLIYNHLKPRIVEVYERRKYIQHLIQVAPFINNRLFEEAKVIVSELGPCVSSLKQVPILKKYVCQAIEKCENYTMSIETILHPNDYSSVTHQLVSKIIESYKTLNSIGTVSLVEEIMEKFSSYLQRWEIISNHLEPNFAKNIKALLERLNFENKSSNIHYLIEKLLFNIECFIDIPLFESSASYSSLNMKEKNFLENILKSEVIELPLTRSEIEEVFKFLNKFPNLIEEARVAIYI